MSLKLVFKRKGIEYAAMLGAAMYILDGFIGSQMMAPLAAGQQLTHDLIDKGQALQIIRDLFSVHMRKQQPRIVTSDGQSQGIQDIDAGGLMNIMLRPNNRTCFRIILKEFKLAIGNWQDIADEVLAICDQCDADDKKAS